MYHLYRKPNKEYGKGKQNVSTKVDMIEPKVALLEAKVALLEPEVALLEPEVALLEPEVAVIGSDITEIDYDEHLKNLELMCFADREFMKRVRFFCDQHKEDQFDVVKPVSDKESSSKHHE